MKSVLVFVTLLFASASAYSQAKANTTTMKTEAAILTCKLTTPELRERKRTVIAGLKGFLLERTETDNGIKYKFESSDKMIDLVSSFIKTERLCCDFFDFNLAISPETGFMWLELSGPNGTKEFIAEEIGL
jgi:hypothetical protein